ncbi:MAG: hypothetical protein Q8O07_08180 [Chloroflexota bacterium]|nr:hypothetical protein [Chloroflexota bacterium]
MNKPLIEVIYKADYCLPCYYMDEAVEEVLPRFAGQVEYQRVCFLDGEEGKQRFFELSISLYGKETVDKLERVAPVPSLFIDGQLVFDMIPTRYELEDAIMQALRDHGLDTEQEGEK